MMCNGGDASTEQLSSCECMARVNICDDSSNVLHQTLGNDVGMQIYRYLHPKDLCSVGSCNRQLRDGIIRRNKLAAICLQHLPLQLGAGTNYSVKLREGASFASKEILFEHVMEKLETARLVHVDVGTRPVFLQAREMLDASRTRARAVLLRDDANSTKFHELPPLADDNEAADIGAMLNNLIKSTITVECYYHPTVERSIAIYWLDYCLNRDACRKSAEDRKTNQFVKEWLACLTSKRNVEFGLWRWTCRHRNLNSLGGILGVGVMITIPSGGGDSERENNITIEVCLTRMY